MNATMHEIASALAPTTLLECMADISELSTPSRTLIEFRKACEKALIANVGVTEALQLLEAFA